jgi:adenylate cyclase
LGKNDERRAPEGNPPKGEALPSQGADGKAMPDKAVSRSTGTRTVNAATGRAGDARPGSGPLLQRLRLWSGLVLFGYVTWHYINHSLGHLSLAAMEAMLDVQEVVLDNPVGLAILYGALAVHVGLALFKLASLRTFRRPPWEWVQIALGLAIPWFLVSHITFTRGAQSALGIEVDYGHELLLLWPAVWVQQGLLLLIVWVHACIGVHFWLRLRPWYPAAMPWLAGLAVAVPALAQTGWIAAARREYDRLQAAGDAAGGSAANAQDAAAMIQALGQLQNLLQDIALGAAAIVAAVIAVRMLMQRYKTRIRVTYGDGTTVNATAGTSLLDVSRMAGIPHMSVCGGRARCSTCRTLVTAGGENLTAPAEAERTLLNRLNADESIRLACQARLRGDVSIRPLIQPQAAASVPRRTDPLGWGVEREIAVLFLDIRGFSRISEKSLPYDIVFILNSLFGEVGGAVERNRGYIDKFMGDGMMALFGLESPPAEASREALRAAIAAQEATAKAMRMLTQHLHEPLRIGIGIHIGNVVVGRIGRTSDQTSPSRLTAIGDTVNIAARLESATKDLKSPIVVSARLLETAGLAINDAIGERHSLSVHNISEPVDAVAIREFSVLSAELGGTEPGSGGKTRARAALGNFRRSETAASVSVTDGKPAAEAGTTEKKTGSA